MIKYGVSVSICQFVISRCQCHFLQQKSKKTDKDKQIFHVESFQEFISGHEAIVFPCFHLKRTALSGQDAFTHGPVTFFLTKERSTAIKMISNHKPRMQADLRVTDAKRNVYSGLFIYIQCHYCF